MKIHELITEAVAKKCWPGHRKVGTQPGTGKNAGKRVNDCEKIKEDEEVDESGLQYYTGVKKHGEEYMKKAAAAGREGASQKEIGALKDKYSKAHKEESVEEAEKKGLYYYVNKRKKAGTSRDASSPKAPTAQAWKDAAKTAKKEGVAEGSNKDVVKSIKVGNFRHDLVDTGMGWQVRIYNGDELYDTGLSKNSEQKGLAALDDAVAYTEKQTNTKRQGVAEGADDKFSVADKVEELVDQYRLYDKRGWTDLFEKLAGRKLEGEEIYREMEYASKFLQLLDSIRMRSDYRGQQDPKKDQELINLSNQWLDLFNKATDEFKGMNGQGVAEGSEDLHQEFDMIENIIESIADQHAIDVELVWEDLSSLTDDELYVFAVTSDPINEDWQKANKKDKTDGMSKKAVNAYRRENPGSKLKTAVTTKPSKLKKGSKASKRRSSYCSRSRGQMKMHSISCAKTPDKAICKARRRWNC